MSKLALVLAAVLTLAACGHVSGPCDNSDPVGVCATAFGQTYEGH
jgi:ABC-type glycerol-3-phosphate transport system substrate-binding protein